VNPVSATKSRHRDVERLLKRLGLSADRPPVDVAAWSALLDGVSRAYDEADDQRYTLERSLEVSSQEMRALHDALSHRARHDALTGLPNRSALKEMLQATLNAHRQSGRRIAVLFIDLDGFKLVNDGLGHAVGDELLIRAAERIRSTIRPDDVVARLGGDEFIVLCTDVSDVSIATDIARRIVEQLDVPFRLNESDSASVSASIGIALASESITADDLIGNADMAMYAAKASGRATFLLFDERMRAQVDDRLATESALRRAVEQHELLLHFQPIISLTEKRMIAAEALLRWNRPGHGLQSAGDFLDVAEQGRLITGLDAWVLGEACRQAVSWPDRSIGVSVNVSSRDVHHNQFIPRLSGALHDSGLHPHRLTLELTETAVMTNTAATTAALQEVSELGVRIAVDDFGTGYWSINHLRRLPARALKIDQSICANIEHDGVAASVVSALVAMGHALGHQVVAEGVERPEQAALLGALGCDAAQGHLFGKPAAGTPSWRS
jgi:diguanylate cyclase (GGDEF)-like protein